MNIYNELKKPIVALAPMEDVTDSVFRQIVLSLGGPDLFFTEFVNVEGLNSKGKEKVIHRLLRIEKEKPIIAQLWGVKPENFFLASQLVKEMGFDGVDINMGCSVKNVIKNFAGSALINEDRNKVSEIISAVKDGAQGLPVSVKTRLGFDSVDIDGWIGFLLNQKLDALTVHMRTARGKDAISADWSYMQKIVDIRNGISKATLLLGNGDIKSLKQGLEYVSQYDIDGFMIGREAISNPWIFSGMGDISNEEKLQTLKEHLLLWKSTWEGKKDYNALKKHFRGYINGYEKAKEIRDLLMRTASVEEALEILTKF